MRCASVVGWSGREARHQFTEERPPFAHIIYMCLDVVDLRGGEVPPSAVVPYWSVASVCHRIRSVSWWLILRRGGRVREGVRVLL